MNTSEQILVIILSSALAVFIATGIVATIKIVQILNDIKRIVRKAENLADKAEAVGEFFQANAGPAAIGHLLSNIFHFHKSKRKKE